MKARILIVDDEENICKTLARHFQYLDYEVQTACNGIRALAIMDESKFEVVISDIRMPEMDGVELLQKIRQDFPMTRVIMMTGYVTMENALACLRFNADTCIFKPIEDLSELENAVDSAVNYLQHWQVKLKMLREMKTDTSGVNNG